MKLRDSFDGNGRFEGNRALRWRSIPADARIVSARATVTPIDANQGGPFAERLSFNDGVGEQGATKVLAGTWVEVDFHARRTLARVVGSHLNPTTLQVDLGGGAYVEINKAGALKTPDPPPNNFFTLTDDSSPLPALTVTKFKLTVTGTGSQPDLNSVIIRSVPTNVSLRVGDLSPFWTHLGELTESETSPDFGEVLQAALANAKVDNGFYDLLLTVHSDTIARLQIDLEIEFLVEHDPLPNGLPEVVLPFDFSTLPQSTAATLNVAVPPNSRVVPGPTTARVRGNFVESRVARGPTGDVKPVAAVEVSPSSAGAQIIALSKDITATAIDLLIESTTPATYLRLDVRDDLDGKPGDTSLLAKPVEFSVDQQAGKGAHWTSVPLTAEFVFSRSEPAKPGLRPQRYWLVLQSLEGTAAWSVDKARDGAKGSAQTRDEGNSVDDEAAEALNMQTTRDGGLSWRDAIAMPGTLLDKTIASSGPFTAFFRLRTQPRTFKVPIVLQAGRDQSEVRVKLDRFQPLGRVDFALDSELAHGINDSLQKTPPTTNTDTEHLHNRDFEQWLRIGENLGRQPEITINAPIHAIAFAPDGALAYVLDQTVSNDFLLVIDVACNHEIEERKIKLANASGKAKPKAFVISPDGTRAYVIDDGDPTGGKIQQLQILDLSSRKVLGKPVDLKLADEKPASDLALSPDGALLYILTLVPPATTLTTSNGNHLRVIDTARLEQQLTADGIPPIVLPAGSGQIESPKALAVSPDGSLLYMLNDRGSGNAVVEICDVTTFTLLGLPIPVGGGATALALTPDGTRAIVANVGSVSVIDTATRTVTPVAVLSPIDVAVSPDGRLAYALNKKEKSITPIDLIRQTAGKDFLFDTARVPVALALAPLGDQIYVAANPDATDTISSISPIQLGARLPGEWQLTSGAVIPFCLGDPFHLVAVLSSVSMPTGLSQVVPVVESGSYEFSFWGISWESDTNEPPAMAEVLWVGANCGSLGTDPVPIDVFGDIPPTDPSKGLGASLFAPAVGRAPSLKLHRVRLTAPAGANQAEVRFTVPSGGAAAIDQVSLSTTSEATANADFKLLKEGRLVGWTVSPGVAPGFSVLAALEGIQLRNAGAATVELLQVAAARKGEPFILEFQGKAISGPTQTNPQVELRWLKTDGTPTASSTNIEIRPDSLGSSAATGVAPDDATQAEIHLSVPAGATLEVKRASLRFLTPTIVPVTFIAEAPGELTVSDIRVAFDRVEPAAPPIPDSGLCVPTPPGREPGETDEDCCFCHHCESAQTMVAAKPVMTAAGRPAMMASCGTCGNELLRAGGRGVSGKQPFLLTPSAGSPPAVIRSASKTAATAPFEVAAKALRLTDIHGIGGARAKQLTRDGIASVENLAASTFGSGTIRSEEPLTAIKGIGNARAAKLAEMGVDTMSKLAAQDPKELVKALPGMGHGLAARIVEDARQRAL